MEQLRVNVDQAFAASRALGNDAVELGEELDDVSGWRLSPKQIANVVERGSLR